MTVLLFSSPPLILYRVQVRWLEWPKQKLGFVTHFCVVFEVCVWIIVRLEDSNMAHNKISESVTYWLCICWYLIESTMCLNKMSRTSSRNIGPQHQKCSSLYHCTDVDFLPPCSPNPSWAFAAKNLILFVLSDHRNQSHLKFQSYLITEYTGACFWMSEDNFSWNSPKQHVVM